MRILKNKLHISKLKLNIKKCISNIINYYK